MKNIYKILSNIIFYICMSSEFSSYDRTIQTKILKTEAQTILLEVKHLLRRKKYSTIIKKIENYLRTPDVSKIPAEIIIKILLNQSNSMCKILEKNIYAKVSYHQSVIIMLIKTIKRNLHCIYVTLFQKTKQYHVSWDINQSMWTPEFVFHFRSINQKQFNKLIAAFFECCLRSALAIAFNLKKYNINKGIGEFVQTIFTNFYFCPINKIKFVFLKSYAKLYKSCHYYQNQMYAQSELITKNIIDLSLQALILARHRKKVAKYPKLKKHYLDKAYKIIVLALLCSIKDKFQLKKQTQAQHQINLILSVIKQLQIPLLKRYLALDILQLEGFLLYRQQKIQLEAISKKYFTNLTQENQFQEQNMVDYYNEKMSKFQKAAISSIISKRNVTESTSQIEHVQRTSKTIHTTKSIKKSKYIGSSDQTIMNLQPEDILFNKTIFYEIQKASSSLLKSKRQKKMSQLYKIDTNNLKDKRKTIKHAQTKSMDLAPRFLKKSFFLKKMERKSHDSFSGLQQIIDNENSLTHLIGQQKDKLRRKKNINKDIEKIIQSKQNKIKQNSQFWAVKESKEENDKHLYQNISSKIGQQTKENIEEIMDKRTSKIDQLVSIIVANKQNLGIKRLVEKIENTQKKKDIRQKTRNSRNKSLEASLKRYSCLASKLFEHGLQIIDLDPKISKTLILSHTSKGRQNIKKANYEISQMTIANLTNQLNDQFQRTNTIEKKKNKRDLIRGRIIQNRLIYNS